MKQVQLLKDLGAQAADEIKAMDQEIHIFSMISHPNLVRYSVELCSYSSVKLLRA